MAWPIRIIRSRLAQIIKSCPYEFPDTIRKVLMLDKIVFRQIRPVAMLHVVRGTLVILIDSHRLTLYREFINPS